MRHTPTRALNGLSEALYRLGDYRGAETAARNALATIPDPGNSQRPSVLVALGAALLAQGKVDESLTHLREANALYEKLNPRTRPFVKLEAKSLLGAALAKKGNLKEGQPLMSEAVEGMRALPWVPDFYLRAARERLDAVRR